MEQGKFKVKVEWSLYGINGEIWIIKFEFQLLNYYMEIIY